MDHQIQIVYTVVVSEEMLKEINRRTDRLGRASRAQVRQWYMEHGTSLDEDLRQAASLHESDDRGGIRISSVSPTVELRLEQDG